VSSAVVFAFASGMSAVGAAWELVALAQHGKLLERLRAVAAPLRAAGAVGRTPTADERLRLVVVLGLTLLAAGWLVAGPWVGLGLATGGPWVLGQVLGMRRRRWQRALAAGAPHVARSLADALAGGHAIRGAIMEAARAGGAGPVVDAELRAAAAALAVGERTHVVLERLRDRAAAPGWETVVAAVLLQRDAGGDLAGLLRTLAGDLEAAGRAEADAHAVTAQARFTARLVCALPLAGAVLAELARPGIVRETASGVIGIGLCAAAVVLQCVALLAVRQLSRMERT
jgi:tight adherence protein B